MSEYLSKRRELERQLEGLNREIEAQALTLKDESPESAGLFGLHISQYQTRKHDLEMELEVLEARHLLDEAERWGVEGSVPQEIYDPRYVGLEPRPYFKAQNKELMRRMISDARRKRIKEWVEIISPVASVIISLLAFLLAALALYLQVTRQTH